MSYWHSILHLVISGSFVVVSIPFMFSTCGFIDYLNGKQKSQCWFNEEVPHKSRITEPEIQFNMFVKPNEEEVRDLYLDDYARIRKDGKVHPENEKGIGIKYPSNPLAPINENGQLIIPQVQQENSKEIYNTFHKKIKKFRPVYN